MAWKNSNVHSLNQQTLEESETVSSALAEVVAPRWMGRPQASTGLYHPRILIATLQFLGPWPLQHPPTSKTQLTRSYDTRYHVKQERNCHIDPGVLPSNASQHLSATSFRAIRALHKH